ncbi:MAG: ABC transporter ATP-binding protein [Actinomyces bowdenii]|nr:ABC transporter ATP-binding protein [Actinomyces bowdenii]
MTSSDVESWYAAFTAELRSQAIPASECELTLQATRSEAQAASLSPWDMYGPASLYAREVASALRAAPPAPPAGPPADPPSRRPRRTPSPAPTPSPATANDDGRGDLVLQLRGVGARRGRRTVLHGIDLEVRRGEVVAVVGANGSGKSTLMQVCAGILRPNRGHMKRTARFGYVPQLDYLAPLLTVDEHLRLFGAVSGMSAGRSTATGHRLLSRLSWRARGSQAVGTLSGGTQQKVNLCLAQLACPDLLLMDEPYQGFDALAYEELWELIGAWRSTGAGILLVTHLLRDIELVDRVVELPAPQEST